MSFFAGLGAFGVAALLTVILVLGTKEGGGGKVTLSWGWCLGLAALAGSLYSAAGFPFDLIASLVKEVMGVIAAAFPKLTMPALAAILLAIALFKKLSKRGISLLAILWMHVCTSAGGPWGVVAERVQSIAQNLGS
jgi:phage-related protein